MGFFSHRTTYMRRLVTIGKIKVAKNGEERDIFALQSGVPREKHIFVYKIRNFELREKQTIEPCSH